MPNQRKSKAAFIILAITGIVFFAIFGWMRMLLPIRVDISTNINKPIYAIVLGSSQSKEFVLRIKDDGTFDDPEEYIKRGDTWAMCITDGNLMYWDGRVEIGQLGTIVTSLQSPLEHKLSSDLKDVLITSKAWEN